MTPPKLETYIEWRDRMTPQDYCVGCKERVAKIMRHSPSHLDRVCVNGKCWAGVDVSKVEGWKIVK